jgi:hypothetical protein
MLRYFMLNLVKRIWQRTVWDQTPEFVPPPTIKSGVVFTVHAWKPPLKLKQRRDQIYMEIQLQPGPAGWDAEAARDC